MAEHPSAGDVHVNMPLTNISVAYIQDASVFIADQAFPNIPVMKQSDRYYVYSRADFNRDEMKERAPGTESAGGGYDLDNTPTYFAPVNAYHKDVSDQVRSNADSPLNMDRDATIFVTQKALIRRERTFAARLDAANWAHSKTGVGVNPQTNEFLQWNDANSTPIENIRDAKTLVLESTGFEPNRLVLAKRVYDALVDHPDIVDRVKYGQTPGAPATVNANALAQLFEVERVLVSRAVYNAGGKGSSYSSSASKEDSSFIMGPDAVLIYTTPTPGLLVPSAGYTFSWNGFMGASAFGSRIKRFRMEHLESDRIEVQMAYDQKVVASDLGYVFADAVAVPTAS